MIRIVESGSALVLLTLGAASVGCGASSESGDAPFGTVTQPVIVGDDDLQYVNAYDGSRGVSMSYVAANKRPVAAISHASDENIATCTGTLIGTNLFITAAHCFQSYGYVPEDWGVYFNHEYVAGEDSDLQPVQSFAVTEVLEHVDNYNDLEYAVLRLGGDPGAAFGWADLRENPASVGEVAAIIGHPASRPKQVDAGHLQAPFTTNTVAYDVDTLARSSGSGVLDAAGKLIAIHTTGHTTPEYNHGARISAILAASPLLRDIAAGSSYSYNLGFCTQAGSQLLSGDYDADGKDDLLCRAGNAVTIAYANASGQFAATGWASTLGFCNQAGAKLYGGDFNGDLRDDLLCRDATGYTAVALANASGQFAGVSWSATLNWCKQSGATLLVGDLNADGRDDLLCRDSTGYTSGAFASSSGQFPAGSWSASINWCKQAGARLLQGDVNLDRRKDLICQDASGYVSWMLANSSGRYSSSSFGQTIDFCKSASAKLYVGDFNGDKRDDLLCRESSGLQSVSLANSAGKYTATSSTAASPWCAAAQHVVAGRFNTDLRSDLTCIESGGQLRITNPRPGGSF
ncbi:MAG: trypsin-like serine protease [Myxococcales bacterium]|nr:MAG: trypsin-like serine protease [Myxococcales bacterium]